MLSKIKSMLSIGLQALLDTARRDRGPLCSRPREQVRTLNVVAHDVTSRLQCAAHVDATAATAALPAHDHLLDFWCRFVMIMSALQVLAERTRKSIVLCIKVCYNGTHAHDASLSLGIRTLIMLRQQGPFGKHRIQSCVATRDSH